MVYTSLLFISSKSPEASHDLEIYVHYTIDPIGVTCRICRFPTNYANPVL